MLRSHEPLASLLEGLKDAVILHVGFEVHFKFSTRSVSPSPGFRSVCGTGTGLGDNREERQVLPLSSESRASGMVLPSLADPSLLWLRLPWGFPGDTECAKDVDFEVPHI